MRFFDISYIIESKNYWIYLTLKLQSIIKNPIYFNDEKLLVLLMERMKHYLFVFILNEINYLFLLLNMVVISWNQCMQTDFTCQIKGIITEIILLLNWF